jgi:tRNA A-37 threonylcarbamoyl transferase component Bud32
VSVEIPGYQVLKPIGKGGMGTVYKARQLSMDRVVAIKVLSKHLSDDGAFRQRFLREARALAKLSHPNVVGAIDAGQVDGLLYFVMELVEGPTLAVHLEQHNRLGEREAFEIALECARALQHAHENGLIHRDVKPQNIILTFAGGVKLCDFGLAKGNLSEDVSVTMTDRVVGTPQYVSPEAVRGNEELDIRSDLYSLGATLYRMVTGTPVFAGANPMDTMIQHVTQTPEDPRRRNPELSAYGARLVMQLLEKDRSRRFQSPADLIAAIERHLTPAGFPVAPRPTRPGRAAAAATAAASPKKPSPVAALIGAVAVVGMLIAGVVLFSGGGKPEEPPIARSKPAHEAPAAPAPGPARVATTAPEPQPVESAGNPEEEFAKAREVILDRAGWLWDRQSASRLTDPYERLLEQVRRAKGTSFEIRWLDEVRKFVEAQEERIEPLWLRMREEARVHEQTGEFAKALAALAAFPDDLKAFKRDEPGRLPTRAGDEHAQLHARILAAWQKKHAADVETLLAARAAGNFAKAWEILAALGPAPQGVQGPDANQIRIELIRAEFDLLVKPPLTRERADAARKRMSELADANAEHPSAASLARQLAEQAPALYAQAVGSAQSRAVEVFAGEILPALEAALERRDTAAARRLVSDLLFASRYAEVQPALRFDGVDLTRFRKDLESPFLADPASLLRGLEDAMIAMTGRAEQLALRDLLFYARAAALLEDLYRRAYEGLDANGRDRKHLKAAKTPLINSQTSIKPERIDPGPGTIVAGKIKTKTLMVAPLGEEPMHAEDVAMFALLTYGKEPPGQYFHLAVALHFAFMKEIRSAQAAIAKVTEPGPSLGLEPIRLRVSEEFAKLPPEEAKPAPEDPKKKPGKKEKQWPFAGKVREVSKTIIEVTYDFSDARQTEDFSSVGWVQGNLNVEFKDKGQVKIDGSGIWYWKGILEGDMQIEFQFTAQDDSVGTIVHGNGTDRGYATFVDYSFNFGGGGGGGGRGPRGGGGGGMFNDQILLIKLPVDFRNMARARLDAKSGAAINPGSRYTIWTRRRGDLIDSGMGSAHAQGKDAEFQQGSTGIWMSRSDITVHWVKITGTLTKEWIQQNMPDPE